MRRTALIKATGIEPKRFDSLARRGQLPFHLSGRGWTEYTADDALRLRLFLTLVDVHGLAIPVARDIAFQSVGVEWTKDHPLDYADDADSDLWAGCVFADRGAGVFALFFTCKELEVQRFALAAVLKDDPDAKIIGLVGCNASEAARYVQAHCNVGDGPHWAKDYTEYAFVERERVDVLAAIARAFSGDADD